MRIIFANMWAYHNFTLKLTYLKSNFIKISKKPFVYLKKYRTTPKISTVFKYFHRAMLGCSKESAPLQTIWYPSLVIVMFCSPLYSTGVNDSGVVSLNCPV